MSANKFILKHHQIEVDYTIGVTPGLTALTYKDGPNVKTFKTNEITTDQTALGSLVARQDNRHGWREVRLLPAPTRRSLGANGEFRDGRRLREVQRAKLNPTSSAVVALHRHERDGADSDRAARATRDRVTLVGWCGRSMGPHQPPASSHGQIGLMVQLRRSRPRIFCVSPRRSRRRSRRVNATPLAL